MINSIKRVSAILFMTLVICVWSAMAIPIGPGQNHTWNRQVGPDTVYRIAIRGQGTSNLDLYVYYGGALVARSEGPGDQEAVQFATAQGGPIVIMVVNRGPNGNDYQGNF